jgi:hypothetical protein
MGPRGGTAITLSVVIAVMDFRASGPGGNAERFRTGRVLGPVSCQIAARRWERGTKATVSIARGTAM